MQGANLESAREDVKRDQIARAPRRNAGWHPTLIKAVRL